MAHPDPAMRVALLLTTETTDTPPTRILAADAREQVERFDPFARYREVVGRWRHLDPVQRVLYTDTSILLPDTFLEKVDKATMAHSIEVRVPFLDAELSNYALGLPAATKVRRGEKKWLLRRALRGTVPDAVLDGRKTGFSVPVAEWLRGPLEPYLRAVLLDRATSQSGIFDRTALERAIDQHVAGRRNNGFLLYKLLNLALWADHYLETASYSESAPVALR